MKKIISFILILTIFPSVLAGAVYDCIDANTLRRTETNNITVDGVTNTIVNTNTLYCQSGCSGTGCTWGENIIFYFMVSVIVLYIIGYLVESPQVMVTASIFGMAFTSISIAFGFYIGNNYFYGTFIRLLCISLFVTFVGLLVWCLHLGKQQEEDGEFIGRRN